MKLFKIAKTKTAPEIILDKDKGVFKMEGRSMLENPSLIYVPATEWINEYAKDPNEETNFHVDLEYFNTSSHKFIANFFSELSKVPGVVVSWHYNEDDEDLLELGERFAQQYNINFKYIPSSIW